MLLALAASVSMSIENFYAGGYRPAGATSLQLSCVRQLGAIVFLLPWFRSDMTQFALLTCLIMHACLVLYRTLSFFMFSGIQGTTYNLAISEWVIFLTSLALFWFFEPESFRR